MHSAVNVALPLAAFVVFLGIFTFRARREGMSVDEWVTARNRHTFTTITRRRGWWIPFVVFAAAAWTALFVMSGFKPVLLIALPVFVLWVPLGTLAFRWFYQRAGSGA